MSNHSALSTPTSRRTVVKGVAWAVPAVTLATRIPAFAASGDQCYPVSWTTIGATGPGTQIMTSLTGTNGTTADFTASYGVINASGSTYNFPQGTSYTPLNMTSSSGSVSLSTYETPGTVTGSSSAYSYIDLTFPEGATGPVTFTISGIDSFTTTANTKGAQYFTDSVGVFAGSSAGSVGTAVTPSSTTSATYNSSTGFTTAAGTSSGTATYTIATIPSSGSVEIRLSNAFSGTIPSGAHPNQTVTISQVACSSTSPTPTPTPGACAPKVNLVPLVHLYWVAPTYSNQLDFWPANEFSVSGLSATQTVTSITTKTWFLGRQSNQDPAGWNIPIWNSANGASSSGPGASNRSGQTATNLSWNPGTGTGWDTVGTSDTTSLVNHTYSGGTTAVSGSTVTNANPAPSWDLNLNWSSTNDTKGVYATGSDGCRTFTLPAPQNPWTDIFTNVKGASGTTYTAFTFETSYTVTITDSATGKTCTISGLSGAHDFYQNNTTEDHATWYNVNQTSTC